MDLKILAEEIGLPKEATPEQMVTRIRGQGAEIRRVVALNEELVKALAEAQSEAQKGRKAQADLVASEGRRVVQKAIADQILDAKDEERFVKQYATEEGRAFVEGYIEDHKYRKVLAAQASLRGTASITTMDGQTELAVKVSEIMANNPKMLEHEAVQKAYREVPGLWERAQDARRSAAEEKGPVK